MISLAGGIAGILVGGLATAIERIAHINTIVSPMSVVVAFGVSVAVGLVFGIVPASRAAKQDPIALPSVAAVRRPDRRLLSVRSRHPPPPAPESADAPVDGPQSYRPHFDAHVETKPSRAGDLHTPRAAA